MFIRWWGVGLRSGWEGEMGGRGREWGWIVWFVCRCVGDFICFSDFHLFFFPFPFFPFG